MRWIPLLLILSLMTYAEAQTSDDFSVSLSLGNATPTTTIPGEPSGPGGLLGPRPGGGNMTIAAVLSGQQDIVSYASNIILGESKGTILPTLLFMIIAVFAYFILVKKPEEEKEKIPELQEAKEGPGLIQRLLAWIRRKTSKETNARMRMLGRGAG